MRTCMTAIVMCLLLALAAISHHIYGNWGPAKPKPQPTWNSCTPAVTNLAEVWNGMPDTPDTNAVERMRQRYVNDK